MNPRDNLVESGNRNRNPPSGPPANPTDPANPQQNAPNMNMFPQMAMHQFFQSMFNFWTSQGLITQAPIAPPQPAVSQSDTTQETLTVGSSNPDVGDRNKASNMCTWLRNPGTSRSIDDDPSEDNNPVCTKRKRLRSEMRLAVANFFAQNSARALLAKTEKPSTSEVPGAAADMVLISDSDDDAAPQPPRANRAGQRPPQPPKKLQKKQAVQTGCSPRQKSSAGPSSSASNRQKGTKDRNPVRRRRCWRCQREKPNGLLKCSQAYCIKCIKELHSQTKPCPRCPKGKYPFRQGEVLYI